MVMTSNEEIHPVFVTRPALDSFERFRQRYVLQLARVNVFSLRLARGNESAQ